MILFIVQHCLIFFNMKALLATVFTSDENPNKAAGVLNDGLCQVARWLSANNLTLNIDKTS